MQNVSFNVRIVHYTISVPLNTYQLDILYIYYKQFSITHNRQRQINAGIVIWLKIVPTDRAPAGC